MSADGDGRSIDVIFVLMVAVTVVCFSSLAWRELYQKFRRVITSMMYVFPRMVRWHVDYEREDDALSVALPVDTVTGPHVLMMLPLPTVPGTLNVYTPLATMDGGRPLIR